MPDLAWLDGEWLPLEEARIPVLDRGNMFGDGVYEVVRSYDGRLWSLDLHLERLERSLRAIGIAGISMAQVRQLVEEGNRRAGYANARVYLHVTRGVAPRVHTYPVDAKPTLLVTVEEQAPTAPALYEQGVAAITLPELRWARRDIKSLNLLPNIMARQQAAEAGAFEAILVQPDGIVTEGASHGIFMVDRGVLITREEGPHILSSITRALVLDGAARLGLPIYEGPFTNLALRRADELFLAGTSPGILPITRLDDYPVADGTPGPVTRRLTEAYFARIAAGDDHLG